MGIQEISLGTANRPHNRAFNASTVSITDLYTSFLPLFNTEGVVKIFIGVVPTNKLEDSDTLFFEKPDRLLNVLQQKVYLDFDFYSKLDEKSKLNLQLSIVHSTCIHLCKAMKWDEHYFIQAYQKCIRAGLVNAWVMNVGKRFFLSPNKLLKACLIGQLTIDKFVVDVLIMTNNSAPSYCQFTRIIESDSIEAHSFKRAFWCNNELFRVSAKVMNKYWDVEVESR